MLLILLSCFRTVQRGVITDLQEKGQNCSITSILRYTVINAAESFCKGSSCVGGAGVFQTVAGRKGVVLELLLAYSLQLIL